LPLISWVYAAVEAAFDGLSEAYEEEVAQGGALRAENRKLRGDIENTGSRIGVLKTEAFNLRHNAIPALSN